MKQFILYWCTLFIAFLWAGCSTDVEICYDTHPHRTLLDFCFFWDEKDVSKKTDSMHVVGIRLSNSIRYDYRVTSHKNSNRGVLLFPEAEQISDTIYDGAGNVVDIPNNRIWARSGDYQFVTFSSNESLQVSDREETEETDVNNALTDLTFTYRPLSLNQCLEKMMILKVK